MSTIEQYISLITQFVIGEIPASQFETRYLEMFKSETVQFSAHAYDVLSELFSDVDSYCGDPELRDEEDLSDEDLLDYAKEALESLKG